MFWHPYYSFTDGSAAPPPPPPVVEAPAPVGGGGWARLYPPKRLKKRELERIENIIESVAVQQVQRLETDDHKIFEELERELQLRGIHWESRYLTLLNEKREILINEEIKLLLKRKQAEDEQILLIMMSML